MKQIICSKLFEDGEYEAILRMMDIRPTRFEKGTFACDKYGDQPVCDMMLHFEILDGSPDSGDPSNWLKYYEIWPDPDLDRILKIVYELEFPHGDFPSGWINSLPVGHRFRVRVGRDDCISTYSTICECSVFDILGLAEPALASREHGTKRKEENHERADGNRIRGLGRD